MKCYFKCENEDLEKGIRTRGLGSLPGRKDSHLKKGGKFPIGTIRSWVDGDVIKRDEDKWVPIEIPDDYFHLSNEIGVLARNLFKNPKLPIKNDKLIGHLLKKHFEEYELQKGDFISLDKYGSVIDYNIDQGLKQMWVQNWIEENELANLSIEKLIEIRDEFKKLNKQFNLAQFGLSDDDFKIYKGVLERSKSIPEEYIQFPLVLKFADSLRKLAFKFKDNFAIYESLISSIDENFEAYEKKFESQIIEDESNRQLEESGLTLDSPLKIFYSKLKARLKSGVKKEFINYVLKKRYAHKLEMKLTNRILWDQYTINAVANFENFVLHLPAGHVLKNPYLNELNNHSYTGRSGHSEGYAFYNQEETKISLSDQFLTNTSVVGNLTEPNEFNSCITHEIGHAVAVKLRKLENLEYKRFVMYCGWDNRQGRKINFNLTDGDKSIPRLGTYNDKPLLTEYSYKSPNECFAEYYSFYYLNKDKLNKWLESGKDEDLIKVGLHKYNPEEKEKWIKTWLGTLDKKIPTVEKIKDERGKIHTNIIYKTVPLTYKEVENVYNKKKNGVLYYRNKAIEISTILKQYLPLKQMKEKIFENEKLIKALVELGILS